jgi:hypothetical protein
MRNFIEWFTAVGAKRVVNCRQAISTMRAIVK